MWKETIICIVLIIAIVIGNYITQDYTKESVTELSNKLNQLKENILETEEQDVDKLKGKMESVKQEWESRHDKLAYYIEHDELEKVTTELTKLKADVETGNNDFAIENLESCIFILEHIKDKSALKIVNIF